MDATFRKHPDLQKYLAEFSKIIAANIDAQSIILFGGIALDDFSSKYSDIDVVVLLQSGLNDQQQIAIEQAIGELTKLDSVYSEILYVYFIPLYMLESPSSEFKPKDGLIYGNGRMRPINQYPLSITDNFSIREKGKVLFGRNLKERFPEPPEDCFWQMFINSMPYIEAAVKKHPFQYSEEHDDHKTVNWLLYFPRLLYSLIQNDMVGKSDSAYWFQEEYNTSIGEFLVEIATCRQENASLHNDRALVLNSRKLVLFTLDTILELNGVDGNLSGSVSIDSFHTDFDPAIKEVRNLIQRSQ